MVSFIIPTYNDTKYIAQIISAIYNVDFDKEIIVVNDASEEKHSQVLKILKHIKLINHSKNKGKTQSLLDGIKGSKGDVIAFIDSDLKGLNSQNIQDLVNPILTGEYEIALSKKGSGLSKMGGYGFTQCFTGDRAFKAKIIKDNLDMFNLASGYQIESEMNRRFFKKHKICVVEWDNVSNPAKMRHGLKSITNDVKMYNDIREYLGIEESAKQIKFASELPRAN